MIGFTTAFMRCLQPVREGRSSCKSLSCWRAGWRNRGAGRAASNVLHWQVGALKGLSPVLLPVKLLPVKSIWLQNETTDTLQARWSPVRGATGYRLTWTSAGRDSGMGCMQQAGTWRDRSCEVLKALGALTPSVPRHATRSWRKTGFLGLNGGVFCVWG